MYTLGIDIGYSSIKVSLLNSENKIKYSKYTLHKGRVKERLKELIYELIKIYKVEDIIFGAITGSMSNLLTKRGNIKFVNEVTAVVEGSIKTNKNVGSIIEIGGQSAKYITEFSEKDKSKIKIAMNSNCSAGTGSYLEEQISRLNLRLEEYSVYASRAKSIPRIAGRCSVFSKTDITHLLQEGVPVEDILMGLSYAVIRNYKGSVIKKLPIKTPLLFVGGVANNCGIIKALKELLNLKEEELIVPEHFTNVASFGAAIFAKENKFKINLNEIIDILKENNNENEEKSQLPRLETFGKNDSLNKHQLKNIKEENKKLNCYLGIDVGSTSTNVLLMNKKKEVIDYRYLKTYGKPLEAIKNGFLEFKNKYKDKVNILGVGITGSGRYAIGKIIGADVIKDEITAQAKAAVTIDSTVDTIFEIGGQDSKYISIEDESVKDFQMNKICAAGTGSFVEEQSKKFNIPINEFGDLALKGESPINLGERCTVFIETSIATNLSMGANINDIASGLCYSIVKNYLDRVVGKKKIGNKIFLQGGIAYNQGIVNAFRCLTGKEIYVPKFFSVTGALGAAILAKEEMYEEKSKFKGFEISIDENDNRQDVKPKINKFSDNVEKFIFEGYKDEIDPKKETIGIPRALFTFAMFPMFYTFFKELGFNVILSNGSNEKTIKDCQKYSLSETCYPVKLINGHVKELVDKKVDYIFFPDLYTADHPSSKSRQNYGCAYMQSAYKIIDRAMELKKQDIKLLSPTMAFNLGKEFMMKSFSKLGQTLGKDSKETMYALQMGMKSLDGFKKKIEENSKKVIKEIKSGEKIFVIVSKIYGVADPVLNISVPDKLINMGYKVIPFYYLPEVDIFKEHPNMYWPFGQHILEAAKVIKKYENLYAIFLTHHGCGPDTVLTHYFREIMKKKTYLNIEVDEHSSLVGVVTRVEAFINSLSKIQNDNKETILSANKKTNIKTNIKTKIREIKDKREIYVPNLYPYSQIFQKILVKQGINAKVFLKADESSIDIGRKYTMTNEYFSLTAILGDVFKKVKELKGRKENIAIYIPQTEGTEVEGQYSRIIRTKLDEEGFYDVDIVSPFIEDLILEKEENVELIYLGLLAGDIVRIANVNHRDEYLNRIFYLVENNTFTIDELKELSKEIYEKLKGIKSEKRILAVGEATVLYNDFLNNGIVKSIEQKGHRVITSPLSETMWLMWKDFEKNKGNDEIIIKRLNKFKEYINDISNELLNESPFERDLEKLALIADETMGYYAGANGRYREGKISGDIKNIDGIITVTSMYENTGIVLNAVHRENETSKPIINLVFDGNKNENDRTKLESFLYYI